MKLFDLLLAGALFFLLLWMLGLITSFTLGGVIHVLLILSIVFLIIWLVFRRL